MHTISTRLNHLFNGLLIFSLLVSLLPPVPLASAAAVKDDLLLREPRYFNNNDATVVTDNAANEVGPASLLNETQSEMSQSAKASGLMFIENVGQFDKKAHFMVRGINGTLYLADNALWFTVTERLPDELMELKRGNGNNEPPPEKLLRGVNLKVSFPGANPHPRLEPFARLDTQVSFFTGSDSANWQTGVPVWGGVRYVDLYPGVDLEITGENGQLIQRLVVRDEADSSSEVLHAKLAKVRLRTDGTEAIALHGNRLRMTTAIGDFTLPLLQPVTTAGTPLDLPAIPSKLNDHEITAPFSASSTASLISPASLVRSPGLASPLPLDDMFFPLPQGSSDLLYSTLLGGSGGGGLQDVAVDGAGNACQGPSTPALVVVMPLWLS